MDRGEVDMRRLLAGVFMPSIFLRSQVTFGMPALVQHGLCFDKSVGHWFCFEPFCKSRGAKLGGKRRFFLDELISPQGLFQG